MIIPSKKKTAWKNCSKKRKFVFKNLECQSSSCFHGSPSSSNFWLCLLKTQVLWALIITIVVVGQYIMMMWCPAVPVNWCCGLSCGLSGNVAARSLPGYLGMCQLVCHEDYPVRSLPGFLEGTQLLSVSSQVTSPHTPHITSHTE